MGKSLERECGREGLSSLIEQGFRSMAYLKKSALREVCLHAVRLVRKVSQTLLQHRRLYSIGQGSAGSSFLFAIREVLKGFQEAEKPLVVRK